ncbi:MAG: hypothetical protein ACYTFG_08085, partial [Planctomycetota bacterium]
MARGKVLTTALTLAAFAFISLSGAMAQDDVEEIKEEIAKLQEKLAKARRGGNWDEFVKVQKRITELYRRLEREHGGEEGEGERERDGGEIEEWIEGIEREIRGLSREKQIHFLEKILGRLKERGEKKKAKAVGRMLDGLRRGGGDREGSERKLHELERHVEELKHAAEKAERDFDFEKA